MKPEISNLRFEIWRRALHAFAVALVIVTFCLVILGGTVTSKEAGLAVPDWPNTYGHNLFLYPPSLWVGNIFWEHTHRLLGALVGVMCIVMCVWLWLSQLERRWLRWTGVALLVLVIAQGVMGGLRVTELSVTLAIVHGVMAQLFLCLTVLIAAAVRHAGQAPRLNGERLRLMRLAFLFFAVLLVQLVLGAVVRHTGAGTAIPDFPTNLGGMVPPLNQAGIEAAFDRAAPDEDYPMSVYPSVVQVAVQFAHRAWAAVVLGTGLWLIGRVARTGNPSLGRPALALLFSLILQVALGALVVWHPRFVDVHTAHQALGAAILATAALLLIRLRLSDSVTPPMADRADDRSPHTAIHWEGGAA